MIILMTLMITTTARNKYNYQIIVLFRRKDKLKATIEEDIDYKSNTTNGSLKLRVKGSIHTIIIYYCCATFTYSIIFYIYFWYTYLCHLMLIHITYKTV